uniref:OSJNBa0016O02.8 protein n=1 Tax=Oryza sativa subsp. japonica TaxID=39947 RepID=Q7XJW2_ORYSJ|nr:OSJNBa0016O02.8 [Oryza sativa Japonica Group]
MQRRRHPLLLLPRRRPPSRTLLSRLLSSSPPASGGGGGGGGGGVAVKQVTRGNLAEALEELRARVRGAAFVGIDLEMSGVTSAPWRDTLGLDRADVRYLKLRDSAERFAALQLGVCPFRWDPAKSAFVAHPTQEEEALQKLYTLHNNETSAYPNTSEEEEDAPLKSAADVLFTERMKIKFNEWRNSIVSNQRVDDHRSENFKFADQFQTVFFKMRPAIMLNGFTSHQLKLIRQILRTHFRDLVYVCTFLEDGVSEKRVVYTDTNEDKISLMKNVREDLLKSREAKVKSAVGIRHVIDLLASERKLIVGHSCFLDIAQIYSKFVGPLPSSMEEFALSINRMFPHMADTRHLMSVNDAVQYRYLASLQVLSMKQLCAYHGIKFEQLSPLEDLATNINLKKHINLLPPCWNSGTVLDLSTGTERPDAGYKRRYPAAVYDNVILIWGFQSKVRPKDIKDCICKVFGRASVTSVFPIDSTAVLVQFSKQESVNDFLDLKATLESADSAISVLHPLSTILEGGKTRAAKYDTYRDICRSSVSKFSFADQAEAVCSTSNSESKFKECNAADGSGAYGSALDGTVPASVQQSGGAKSGSKNKGDDDFSYQDILDALQDGKTSVGKRMSNA